MKINAKIEDFLHDGMTIAISGVDSALYPKTLIKKIKDSNIKGLTLIYIENNSSLDPAGDPMDLILNGQVDHLVTSHLGYLEKTYKNYLKIITLLPMDVLCFKLQSGANRLPGIIVDWNYAALYRNSQWLQDHEFYGADGKYAIEYALNADLAIGVMDAIDPISFNTHFNGTSFNSMDTLRCANISFVEAMEERTLNPDESDLPGVYINGYVISNASFQKTNDWN